jgi:NAD(P)-dependent dehydrogenase (short-subunit alcohol dehydrogenase family)
MNRLINKIVVVTGGSGLLGQSIIKQIRKEGGFAINADIKHSTNLSEGLINCDVTDIISVQKCIRSLINEFGKIDGWVNNAYPRTDDWGDYFEDINILSWKNNIDMQLNSVFICCQEVLKVMKAQKYGSIVNIASIYGIVGPDFSIYEGTSMTMPAAYSAIKGGVINFTRYLASYYGLFDIRVNCVSPGGIFDNQTSNFVNKYETKVPLRRMGLPEDISPAVTFLLGKEASYITGQNIIIDGGWTII